jgi:hypothetical protein
MITFYLLMNKNNNPFVAVAKINNVAVKIQPVEQSLNWEVIISYLIVYVLFYFLTYYVIKMVKLIVRRCWDKVCGYGRQRLDDIAIYEAYILSHMDENGFYDYSGDLRAIDRIVAESKERYRVGSISAPSSAVVPINYGVKKTGAHEWHIVPVEYKEKFGGHDLDYTVYWMPTAGYCSKLAAAFHYMVEREIDYWDFGDFNVFGALVDLIRPPVYNGMYPDGYDSNESLVKGIFRTISTKWGLGKGEGKDEALAVVLKQYKLWGVPLAVPGSSGVVFCKQGDILHCGYKCLYTKPKAPMSPKAWCTLDLLKKCKVACDDFKYYIDTYRKVFGGNDAYVECSEFVSYLKLKGFSYNLYMYRPSDRKIHGLESSSKYADNVLVKGLLRDEHWSYYDPKPSKEEKDSKKVDAKPFPATLKPGCTVKSDSWIVEVDYRKIYLIDGVKYFFNGKDLIHSKNAKDSLACARLVQDDLAHYDGEDWLVSEREKFGSVYLLQLIKNDPMVETDYDKFGFSYSYRYQADPSPEHDVHIEEFMHISDKYQQMKNNLVGTARAAKLYVSTATRKPVPFDWVLYRMVKFIRLQEAAERELRHVASGDFWKRKLDFCLRDCIVRGLIGLYFNTYFRVMVWWFFGSWFLSLVNVVYSLAFIIGTVYLHWNLFLSVFVPLCICLYRAYFGVPEQVHMSLRAGRLTQELSFEKVAELYLREKLETVSLNKVSCWWLGQQISFGRLLKNVESLKKTPKIESVSRLVPSEWESRLHKIAPASVLGSLWAFIIRASTPMAEP